MFLIAAHHYKIVMIGKLNFQEKKLATAAYEKASVCLGLHQRVTLSRDRKQNYCEIRSASAGKVVILRTELSKVALYSARSQKLTHAEERSIQGTTLRLRSEYPGPLRW